MLDGDGVVLVWVVVETLLERPPDPDPPDPDPCDPAPEPPLEPPPDPPLEPREWPEAELCGAVAGGIVLFCVGVVDGLVELGVVEPLGRV
jgi:hypothetical protein